METIVVLDTSVVFDFLAGHPKTTASRVEHLLLGAQAALSVISVYELLRGVESDKHFGQRRQLIDLCTVLDLTPSIAQSAAGIYTNLKKRGSLVHNEDILIAATALHWHYPVLTLNIKDFSRIPGVRLE